MVNEIELGDKKLLRVQGMANPKVGDIVRTDVWPITYHYSLTERVDEDHFYGVLIAKCHFPAIRKIQMEQEARRVM